MNNLTTIELNAILYYADFLSIKAIAEPITDICKYFFIYGAPINAAYIAGNSPIYDENNAYFKESYDEYTVLKSKFGEEGVMSFIDNICSLNAVGRVSGEDMIRCAYRFAQKNERFKAMEKYKNYMKNLRYSHLIKTDDGKVERRECTKYVAHYEQAKGYNTQPELSKSAE